MKKILIFGGSGFIGTSLVNLLLKHNYEIIVICNNIDKANKKFNNQKNLTIKNIDIFNKDELIKYITDSDIIINLIGKLFERKNGDFSRYHEEFPKILAQLSDNKKLIHLSALAIENSAKTSLYASTKLAGEENIKKYANNYIIIKPSIVFGNCDNFFNLFAKISSFSPFLPLIGGGNSLFAPIYVEDIAAAILILIENQKYKNEIFEAFGHENVSFKSLLEFILETKKQKRIMLNLPYNIAKFEARIMNMLKIYLLTPDQVELLKYNNISHGNYQNIDILGLKLENYKNIVPTYLK